MSNSYRWGPLTGVVAVVLIVVAFLVAGSSPDTGDPDAKIAAYLAKDSSFNRNITALLIGAAAVALLAMFFAALRTRLAADVRLGNLASLVYGMGIASSVFFFAAISGFTASVVAAHDAKPATLDPDFYRFSQDFGYMFWIAAGVFGAVAIWTSAAAMFRSDFLPGWFGWVSLICGLGALLSLFFLPMFLYGLWVLIAGLLLTARTPNPIVATTTTATTV